MVGQAVLIQELKVVLDCTDVDIGIFLVVTLVYTARTLLLPLFPCIFCYFPCYIYACPNQPLERRRETQKMLSKNTRGK